MSGTAPSKRGLAMNALLNVMARVIPVSWGRFRVPWGTILLRSLSSDGPRRGRNKTIQRMLDRSISAPICMNAVETGCWLNVHSHLPKKMGRLRGPSSVDRHQSRAPLCRLQRRRHKGMSAGVFLRTLLGLRDPCGTHPRSVRRVRYRHAPTPSGFHAGTDRRSTS